MYDFLLKLFLLAVLAQMGVSIREFENCRKEPCVVTFEKKSREILKVNWKPISVFSREQVRFQ